MTLAGSQVPDVMEQVIAGNKKYQSNELKREDTHPAEGLFQTLTHWAVQWKVTEKNLNTGFLVNQI